MPAGGGVCAVLDYDVEMMAEYVAEMAVRVVTPQASTTPAFRKFVSQVLTSTRLPSTTILLGMNYLAKRINALKSGGGGASPHHLAMAEGQVWRYLTVGLLLGSKFLDDNTFQNKSWSDVSGIAVSELNHLEKDWICGMEWGFYVNLETQKDFQAWISSWKNWEGMKKTHVAAVAAAAAAAASQAQANAQVLAAAGHAVGAKSPQDRLPLQRLNTELSRLTVTTRPAYSQYSLPTMDAGTYYSPPYLNIAKRNSVHEPPSYRAQDIAAWRGMARWHQQQPSLPPPPPPDSGYATPEYNLSATSTTHRYNDWFQSAACQQSTATGNVYMPRQSQAGYQQQQQQQHHHQSHPQYHGITTYAGNIPAHHGMSGECFCTTCMVIQKQSGPYFGASHGYATVAG